MWLKDDYEEIISKEHIAITIGLFMKVSILSLSLVLTTSFSISSALPHMFEYYKDLPKSQIELLVSLPSAGIMLTLFLNTFI